MSRVDKTCEMSPSPISIQDLPNEILSQILAKRTLQEHLNIAKQVCRRWYALIDETVGCTMSISSMCRQEHTEEIHLSSKCVCGIPSSEFEMISRVGVRICCINLHKFEDIKDDKTKSMSTLPTFKYPHLVEQIFINGSIRSNIFSALLTGTRNLTLLQINLLSLHQLKTSDLKQLNLNKLKVLTVQKCTKFIGTRFDETCGLANLQEFLLNNIFYSLCTLNVRFPVAKFNDFSTIKSILIFLKSHIHLKNLNILMDLPFMVDITPSYQEEMQDTFEELKKLAKMQSSLINLEIQGIRLHTRYPHLGIWKEFTLFHKNLKSLTLRLGSLSKEALECICKNNKDNLELLYLYKLSETREDFSPVELDCAAFSCLKRLNTLYALGCDTITKATELPISVHTLFITGSIRAEEAEHIILKLPKLKFVSLRNACNQKKGWGVSLDILHHFLEQKRVRRLILNGSCLCEMYPPEGIPNGDPNNPIMLTEFDNWDPDQTYLDWELNSDKFYINKYY